MKSATACAAPVTPGWATWARIPRTALGCVKTGGKYVFVSKGKVYGIQNQDFGTLAANAGAKVQVARDVVKDGKNITLTKIAPAGK